MGDALGGGVMVAIAAALWIAYLLPSWLHRRQYLATERNAVRLQQTLRVLAETAETPEHVRLDLSARSVASQERVLREREAAERARLRAEEQTALADRRLAERAAQAAARAAQKAGRARGRSLRRARAVSSLVLLASLVVAGVAAFSGGWMLAAGGALGVAASLTAIVLLARAGARPHVATVAAPVAVPRRAPAFVPVDLPATASAPASWTPTPLPKPLASSPGSRAALAMDTAEATEARRRAAVLAAMSEKAAELNQAVPLRPKSVPAAAAAVADARFARMGIVENAEPALSDLDAVMRRRRAG